MGRIDPARHLAGHAALEGCGVREEEFGASDHANRRIGAERRHERFQHPGMPQHRIVIHEEEEVAPGLRDTDVPCAARGRQPAHDVDREVPIRLARQTFHEPRHIAMPRGDDHRYFLYFLRHNPLRWRRRLKRCYFAHVVDPLSSSASGVSGALSRAIARSSPLSGRCSASRTRVRFSRTNRGAASPPYR